MAREIMIAPVDQYIINQVRTIRRALGISAERLSEEISVDKSISLITKIESSTQANTYSDHHLNLIARVLTRHAMESEDPEQQRAYSIQDFYPPVPLSDDPVIKKIASIERVPGTTFFLKKVMSDGFLDTFKSLQEVLDEVNIHSDKPIISTSLSSAMTYFSDTDLLERMYVGENKVLYRRLVK